MTRMSSFLIRSDAENAAGINFKSLKKKNKTVSLEFYTQGKYLEKKKDFSRHKKAERIYHQQTCIIILQISKSFRQKECY